MSRPTSRVYHRRRLAVFGTAGVVLAVLLYTLGMALAPAPTPAVTGTPTTALARPAARIDWPASGSAAVGAVGYPGVLASTGSSKPVPIASMTKTITALVVLDKKPLARGSDGPTITFTQKDVDIWHDVLANGGSWAPVVAGEKLTERQALEAMLLPSANNYARSLARWSYGSVKKFLSAAGSWLARHGLTDTHLTDPAGLDAGTVSTPADLLEIGKLVIANPVLASIVSTREVTLPGAGHQRNGNRLLGHVGIDGIKTGFTDEAGHCLLFSADVTVGSKRVSVVGVMLGQKDYDALWTRVPTLLASVKRGFHDVPLAGHTGEFGQATTAWGERAPLVASTRRSLLVWSDRPIRRSVSASTTGTVAGSPAGHVTYASPHQSVTVPLTLGGGIDAPGLWWKLTHPVAML